MRARTTLARTPVMALAAGMARVAIRGTDSEVGGT